jgi:hypothetical protein
MRAGDGTTQGLKVLQDTVLIAAPPKAPVGDITWSATWELPLSGDEHVAFSRTDWRKGNFPE